MDKERLSMRIVIRLLNAVVKWMDHRRASLERDLTQTREEMNQPDFEAEPRKWLFKKREEILNQRIMAYEKARLSLVEAINMVGQIPLRPRPQRS